jgi:hypothetical protein
MSQDALHDLAPKVVNGANHHSSHSHINWEPCNLLFVDRRVIAHSSGRHLVRWRQKAMTEELEEIDPVTGMPLESTALAQAASCVSSAPPIAVTFSTSC